MLGRTRPRHRLSTSAAQLRLHRRVGLAAALVAVLVGFAAPSAIARDAVDPVRAPAPLVALGDSYASGLGTRSYAEAAPRCARSRLAYGPRVARHLGVRVRLRACAGATVADVRRRQLRVLRRRTRLVTLTVGGNDAGFTDVIVTCARPWWASDCSGAVRRARRTIRTRLPARLDRLLTGIRSRSPRARLVVTGYPRLFMGEDCNAGTWFSPTEQRRLNRAAGLLDRVIRDTVRGPAVRFVDPRQAFAGHAVCADVEWINGLSRPVRESYHPNRRGQRGYARLVWRRLRVATDDR